MYLLWTVFCISGQTLKYNESRRNGLLPHDELCYDENLSNGVQIVCPVKC
jgi:hypothetical protein